ERAGRRLHQGADLIRRQAHVGTDAAAQTFRAARTRRARVGPALTRGRSDAAAAHALVAARTWRLWIRPSVANRDTRRLRRGPLPFTAVAAAGEQHCRQQNHRSNDVGASRAVSGSSPVSSSANGGG